MNALGDARVMFQAGRSNGLTASQAITPFAFFQSFQSGFGALSLGLPSAFRSKRHGLDLHSVNARKPAHTVLIKFNGSAVGGADLIFLVQFLASPEKSLTCSHFVHGPNLSTEQ